MEEKEKNLMREAALMAMEAHAKQVRKYNGNPYITHPARVATRLLQRGDATWEMVAAGWLHDTLEDTELDPKRISEELDERVLKLVLEMTNTSKKLMPNAPRAERRKADRERLSKISREAKLIKLLDRIDNMSELLKEKEAPKDFIKLYKEESLALLEVLKGTDAKLEEELKKLCE